MQQSQQNEGKKAGKTFPWQERYGRFTSSETEKERTAVNARKSDNILQIV